VTLRSENTPVSFQWILSVGDDGRKNTAVTLRFDRQDQNFALDSIQYGKMTTHRLNKTSPHSEHKTVISAQGQ